MSEEHRHRTGSSRPGHTPLRVAAILLAGVVSMLAPVTANAGATAWSQAASLNTARDDHGAASGPCRGDTGATCIYAIGGVDRNSNVLNSVEMHAPGSSTWSQVASLNTARALLGATNGPCQGNTDATCLYAIGGGNVGPFGQNTLASVEMYSPSSNSWTTVASLNTARFYLAATNGPCQGNIGATCIYAIGGLNSSHNPQNLVEMYDPSTNTWTTVAPMNTPRAFVAATNGPCQGNASDTCVYAISGSDTNNGYLSSVEMYTPSNNTWSAVASLNTAQATAGATSGACQGNAGATCLYAIGGTSDGSNDLTTVEMYDPSSNAWSTVASLNTGRQILAAASGPCQDNAISRCLYAIGGLNGSSTFLSSVESYTLPNAWIYVASLGTARTTLGATSGPCQGNTGTTCLYALGGYNNGDLSSVEMYTPGNNNWSAVAPLNTARSGLRTTSGPCRGSIGSTCLYAIGGLDSNSNNALSTVEMYNPSSNTWSTVASLQTARYNFGATSGPCHGNTSATCLYAMGGYNSGYLTSVEMYTPSSNSWSYVASLGTARYLLGATHGPCQGNTSATCLYAIGGYAGGQGYLNSVEMYNPGSSNWSTVTSLHTARNGLGATNGPCQGNISTTCLYANGGDDNGTVLSSVEMYDPASNSWSSVVSLHSPRNDSGAASGPCQGSVSANCIYAIGGQDSARNALSSVEMYAPANSSNPTAAWVSPFVVRRHGETVHFQWQAPGAASTGSRLLGFNLFAGGHRLNPHLIRVHGQGIHSHVYHFTARRAGHGPYTLMAVLANGTQLAVAHG